MARLMDVIAWSYFHNEHLGRRPDVVKRSTRFRATGYLRAYYPDAGLHWERIYQYARSGRRAGVDFQDTIVAAKA